MKSSKYWRIMNKSLKFVLLGVMAFSGCNVGPPPPPETISVDVKALEWRTEGGGNLFFNVRRASVDEFTIEVTQRDFRAEQTQIGLTRQKSVPMYDLMDWVFKGNLMLASPEPDRGETGTWTSVFVIDGNQQRHKISISQSAGELRSFRYWVEDQLQSRRSGP